jgi:hypothetical protein
LLDGEPYEEIQCQDKWIYAHHEFQAGAAGRLVGSYRKDNGEEKKVANDEDLKETHHPLGYLVQVIEWVAAVSQLAMISEETIELEEGESLHILGVFGLYVYRRSTISALG